MKELSFKGLILFIGLCLLCFSNSACSQRTIKPMEKWEENEFFGTNLDQPDQVRAFHNLLESGSIEYEGRQLTEWDYNGMGSDYDLSNGKVSTTMLFEGSYDNAKQLYEKLDDIMYSHCQNCLPLRQKDWITGSDGIPYKNVMNYYDYGSYRISITLRQNSTMKDENNCESANLLVGLGVKPSRE